MFSAFFIQRPKFAMVVSFFIVIAGLICIFRLPIAEYPEVSPPTITVSAAYPGASALVIADTIAAPLEAEINGIEDMIYYASNSNNSGGYNLTLTFKPGTDSDIAMVNVNNAVKRVEAKLPSEVSMNGLTVMKRSADFLGLVAFTTENPEHTPIFLSNYVSINVKDAVSRIDGVGQAIIFGAIEYSMRVWLDPIKLRALDLGHEEIVAAIRSQNIQAATGSVGDEAASEYLQFKVDTRGRLKEPEEFADIIVRADEQGGLVRLSDVARVELGAEKYSGLSRKNGDQAIMMAVFKQSDANALAIIDELKTLLGNLEKNFPEGLTWSIPYNSTKFVVEAMKEIVTTLMLTFVLVVLITYLFLQDWRATLIPAIAIPVSLIGTFFFLYLFGMSINTLTMFGLILVIGSVVDDAICVVECCMRLILEEKLAPREAALRTMQELTTALLATTLVVVAIYTPIAFYSGMVGTIYQQFAVTMCIALGLSTFVALTLSPTLCGLVLRDTGEAKGPFRLFNRALDTTRTLYVGCAGFLVRRITVTILLLAFVLAGNYFLFHRLPSAFVPAEDKGALLCEVVLPSGAALPRTEAMLDELTEKVLEIEGVDTILTIPGRSMLSGEGENMGMVIVNLKDWSQRKTASTKIAAIQRELMLSGLELADATFNAFVPPAILGLGMTGGVSFALQATGDQTPQELSQAAQELIGKIMGSEKALYAMTSFSTDTPMIQLELDRDKAEVMDVSVSAVFSALQSQLGSVYVNDFNLYGKTYKVKVQSESEYRENMNTIQELAVLSKSGDLVPIEALATAELTLGPRQSERFNMFPSASIMAQSAPGVSSGELMDAIQELVRTELGGDYTVSWTDMSYQEKQNEGQIIFLVFLALLFAYLFLAAQYESWMTPVSVMLSVTVATLGGMLALNVTGKSMDIYCQLGLLMLIGLTAKTSILMVEYSKQLRDGGMDLKEAALTGMRVRFRAVMMTALSFIIGVSPMVIASGAGAGSRQAIGVTTFWGMILATALGMILIPSLYVISRTLSEWMKKS